MKKSLLVVLLLAGCAREPQVEYRNVYIVPKAAWVQPCPIALPPEPFKYASVPTALKLEMMTQWAVAQTNSLANCNEDKAALREYVLKVQAGP